nr:hypothetical protein [Micromonospora sp. DSM 115978]
FSGGQPVPDEAWEGSPSATFDTATKAVGAKVSVTTRDGRVRTVVCPCAPGSAGAGTRRDHPELASRKLLASGVAPAVVAALAKLPSLTHRELDDVLQIALTLPD